MNPFLRDALMVAAGVLLGFGISILIGSLA